MESELFRADRWKNRHGETNGLLLAPSPCTASTVFPYYLPEDASNCSTGYIIEPL